MNFPLLRAIRWLPLRSSPKRALFYKERYGEAEADVHGKARQKPPWAHSKVIALLAYAEFQAPGSPGNPDGVIMQRIKY